MQARKSIDRLLGLLCAALLFTLVGSCREEPAKTAGHETDQTVQLASERSKGELEKLGREWDEAVRQTRQTAQELVDQGIRLASERGEEMLGGDEDEAVEETHEAARESEHSGQEVGPE